MIISYFIEMINQTPKTPKPRATQKTKSHETPNITDIIRENIEKAILNNDEKTAKLQLEILEKYQKIVMPEPKQKPTDYKERRRKRDELMAQLLERFERLQKTD